MIKRPGPASKSCSTRSEKLNKFLKFLKTVNSYMYRCRNLDEWVAENTIYSYLYVFIG